MKKLICTLGISGSGKTTWLNNIKGDNKVIVETDIIRQGIFNDVNDTENDIKVFEIAKNNIIIHLNDSNIDEVYFGSTLVDTQYRLPFIKSIIDSVDIEVEVEIVVFKSDIDISTKRVSNDLDAGVNRADTISGDTISEQYEMYIYTLKVIENEFKNVIYL